MANDTPPELNRDHIASSTGRFIETDTTTRFEYIAGPVPAARLAVVFGSMDMFDLRRELLGQSALLDAHFDILAVRPAANNWYQDVSEKALADILAVLPLYRERIAIGADMGGYAAIYFAAAAGAARVLAISPVYSQDSALTPWENRWSALAPEDRNHRPMVDVLDGFEAPILILYDPQTHDRDHVALFKMSLPDIAPVAIRYADSPVSLMLDEVGLLVPHILAFAQNQTAPDASTLRAARRRSAQSLKALARAAIRKGHTEVGETLFERSLEIRRGVDTLLTYGRYLAEARRPSAALPYIDEAIRTMPPHAHFMAFRAHLEELTGDLPAAADSYALAAQYDPDVAEFRQSEARVLRAIIALNRGLSPSNPSDDRSALAQLDQLKSDRKMGTLDIRKIFGGVAASIAIVIAFWVLSGIFEWR